MRKDPNGLSMPEGGELVISASPHIRTDDSVAKIMFKVQLALLPAVAAGVVFFGWHALRVVGLCVIFCVAAEALWLYLAKKAVRQTLRDGSAALTGTLLGLNLSAGTSWHVCLIGAVLAIWLGKQIFGGLGHNPFNPALVARVGLLIALPAAMTTWVPPAGLDASDSKRAEIYSKTFYGADEWKKLEAGGALDAVSCATPLGVAGTTPKITGRTPEAEANFQAIDNSAAYREYFLGRKGGCLGETSALALLIGGAMLLFWRLIDWRIPLFYIGTVAVTTGIIHHFHPGVTPTAVFHVLTGGLMLGAFFMATDMVTSPMTGIGCAIFAIGCGVMTSVIRIWGNYPEGVSFSILFMNALVPLIDRAAARRPFGYVRKREKIR